MRQHVTVITKDGVQEFSGVTDIDVMPMGALRITTAEPAVYVLAPGHWLESETRVEEGRATT